jgi:hypothetical protein
MQGYKLGTTGVIEAAGTPSCPQCSCDASGAAVAAAPGEAAEVAPAAVVPAAGGGTSAPALAGWRSSPHVGDASYTSQVPRRQLDKGVVSYGSRARARRAVAKLLRGEPLSVATIGGSITWCAAALLPACVPAQGVHSPAAHWL